MSSEWALPKLAKSFAPLFSKRAAVILGIVTIQMATAISLVYVMSLRERSPTRQNVLGDLLPNLGEGVNPGLRDLQPPPLDSAREIIQNASFFQGSDLRAYLQVFPEGFAHDLARLRGNQTLVDAGAGDATFAEQYVSLQSDSRGGHGLSGMVEEHYRRILDLPLSERAKTVAIDADIRRRDIPSYQGRLKVLTGRLFEEIPDEEIGKAAVITDLLGVMAYAPQVDAALRKYVNLLENSGVIYVYLGEGVRSNYSLKTTISLKDGRKVTLNEWLSRIPGLEVVPLFGDVHHSQHLSIRIQIKNRAAISIPQLQLLTIRSDRNSPPTRIYAER